MRIELFFQYVETQSFFQIIFLLIFSLEIDIQALSSLGVVFDGRLLINHRIVNNIKY